MKTTITTVLLSLTFFATGAQATSAAVNCFEREWIMMTDDNAKITIEQLKQMITTQIPYLKVTDYIKKDAMLVAYKETPNKSAREDVPALRRLFNRLPQDFGILVECNGTVEPMPSLTGSN